uniref:replication initiation protein n=1 Tax=Microscilla sp. PRE1 TaxID=155537 RepID=UPI00146F0EB8|nr:replication initiation protein [Microscilla sp. PRE1]
MNLSNGYTPQFLNKCLQLKGKYAPALYDFICKYDQPKILSWYDLRIYLDIKGTEYTDWQSFKKGVLARSKAQIEKVTARTFHYKVVKGERTEDLQIKKIKIWGGFNEKVVPKEDRETVKNMIYRLELHTHKQSNYIQEFVYENYEEVIALYNEVVKYPDYQNMQSNDKRWKDVGLTILKRLKLG